MGNGPGSFPPFGASKNFKKREKRCAVRANVARLVEKTIEIGTCITHSCIVVPRVLVRDWTLISRRGATGKSRVRNFLRNPPPSSIEGQTFSPPPPLLKSGNFLHPPSIRLNLPATM